MATVNFTTALKPIPSPNPQNNKKPRIKTLISCKKSKAEGAWEKTKVGFVDYNKGKHKVSVQIDGLRKDDLPKRHRLRIEGDRFQVDWSISEVVNKILKVKHWKDIEGILNCWGGRFARKNFPVLIKVAVIGSSLKAKVKRCHTAEEGHVVAEARAVKAEGDLVRSEAKVAKLQEEMIASKASEASLATRIKELELKAKRLEQFFKKSEDERTAVEKVRLEEFEANAPAVARWKAYAEGQHQKYLDLQCGIVDGCVGVENGVVVISDDAVEDETAVAEGRGTNAEGNEQVPPQTAETAFPQVEDAALPDGEVVPETQVPAEK